MQIKIKSELCTNSRSPVVMTHSSFIIIHHLPTPLYKPLSCTMHCTPASNLTRITQSYLFSTPTTAFPKKKKTLS